MYKLKLRVIPIDGKKLTGEFNITNDTSIKKVENRTINENLRARIVNVTE